jgi:ADP-ribosyl-[dinitrogen reductase] hydrolase
MEFRMNIVDDRYRGCLLGLAIGDALGAPVEFKVRGTFPPIKAFSRGGAFNLRPGEWTDDTSMALCLGASLVESGKFDPDDIMRRWLDWYRMGYLSVNGTCFDIGTTTAQALRDYERSHNAIMVDRGTYAAGNGAIMRLAPLALAYALAWDEMLKYSVQQALLTHGGEAMGTSAVFSLLVAALACGADKRQALALIRNRGNWIVDKRDVMTPALKKAVMGEYGAVKASGYSVATLNAALWAFETTENFADCVLAAVNLGDDADTVGAVAGAFAGAYYGEHGIAVAWRDQLAYSAGIGSLGTALRLLCMKREVTAWRLGEKGDKEILPDEKQGLLL